MGFQLMLISWLACMSDQEGNVDKETLFQIYKRQKAISILSM